MAKKKVEQENTATKFEMVEVGNIIPYVNNARKHSEKQINQICASIQEFGFLNPCLVDKNNSLIAGHGRIEAATKLGMKKVPCIRLEHLSDSQRKAYIIADNKLALNSEWDEDLLKLEFEELKELDFSIDIMGFDDVELKKIIGELEAFEPDLPDENDGSEKEPTFILRVEFSNEDEQQMIFTELRDRGYKVKV